MPIYEFICLECGNQFEKIQSFSDTSLPSCPQCSSERVQKRLSPPAVHFKGSGWYVTDSKNGSKSAGGKNGSNPEGASAEKAEPDKKPAEATKSETTSTTETASKGESTTKSETKAAAKESTA